MILRDEWKAIDRMMNRAVAAAMKPFQRRVRNMVMRAIVDMVDDSKKLQTLQASRSEDITNDDIERFQQYGFSSVPPKDSEALILLVGSNADHPVAVSVDFRDERPTELNANEVALWMKQHGIRMLLCDDGKVKIGTDPDQKATRDDRNQNELKALRDYVETHTHPFVDTTPTGTITSNTSPPASGPPPVGNTACDEVYIK